MSNKELHSRVSILDDDDLDELTQTLDTERDLMTIDVGVEAGVEIDIEPELGREGAGIRADAALRTGEVQRVEVSTPPSTPAARGQIPVGIAVRKPEGSGEDRWYAHLAASLVNAAPEQRDMILGLLGRAAPRQLVAALSIPGLPDEVFDKILWGLRHLPDDRRAWWLDYAAKTAASGPNSDRAHRLRVAEQRMREQALGAICRSVQSAAPEVTPLLVVPAELTMAWEGAAPPSGGRVVEAESRWGDANAAATDYDAAMDAARGRAALTLVGDGQGLVFPRTPCPTDAGPPPPTHLLEVDGLDGFGLLTHDCEGVAARWVATPSASTTWRGLGTMDVTESGRMVLTSSIWPGKDWQRAGGIQFDIAPGWYKFEELRFQDERGCIQLVRAIRIR